MTAAQDETGQVRQLKAAGCEKVFRDKITGTMADRPQLAKLMKALAPGDVVTTPRRRASNSAASRPSPRTSRKRPALAEPELEEVEYQHILSIIETMAKTMERDPDAFRAVSEEHLRTMFLVPLNSQYEGHASGETFNYNGKTDILIRSGDRNIFIAECKYWGGPAVLTATINQLLGYLSWRDSKAAIIPLQPE